MPAGKRTHPDAETISAARKSLATLRVLALEIPATGAAVHNYEYSYTLTFTLEQIVGQSSAIGHLSGGMHRT